LSERDKEIDRVLHQYDNETQEERVNRQTQETNQFVAERRAKVLEDTRILAEQREARQRQDDEFRRIQAEADKVKLEQEQKNKRAALIQGLDKEQIEALDELLAIMTSQGNFGTQYDPNRAKRETFLNSKKDILIRNLLSKGRDMGSIVYHKKIIYEARNGSVLLPTENGNYEFAEDKGRTKETSKMLTTDTEKGGYILREHSTIRELNLPIDNIYHIEISEEPVSKIEPNIVTGKRLLPNKKIGGISRKDLPQCKKEM
jgi:hypothetical protein